MQVKKRDGSFEDVDKRKISRCVERACKGLEDVEPILITDEAYQQLFDGMSTAEIDRAAVLAARARIASEPNYSYVAARLLLHSLYREVFDKRVDGRSLTSDYREKFQQNLLFLVENKRLDVRLTKLFNLDKLSQALRPERDLQFKYLGVQTLYDRYILHVNGRRLETPQGFWMRVAMGLSLNEPDPTSAAITVYELVSTFRYCPSTPTLFNAGTNHPQLSSCYLSTVEDSIDGIYGTLHGQARLSKYAGGLAVDLTPLRGTAAWINGTNGPSTGIIPWAKQFNDLAVAVNQGSKRRGALCLYLENWHIDVQEYLDLRKNTGDDRRRCHDINTANWIPDLFMKQVKQNGDWYLFSPDDCSDLHDSFGDSFEALYWKYVSKVKAGKLKNVIKIAAKDLWKKMLTSLKETGHPWITFKDPSNLRYANQHAGVVHSSNLCVEIQLHTKPTKYEQGEVVEVGETAVCNLASINLDAHSDNSGTIDFEMLAITVREAIRFLDNVIDINFYPIKEAKNSNLKNRPVGLGLMGWQDLLHKKQLSFDSKEAVDLADEIQEFISYHAIISSANLSKERGSYPNYQGSLWSKGVFPHDTWVGLMTARGTNFSNPPHKMDWKVVKDAVASNGMRNGLVMAIAPTATISYILGCSQSIEPGFSVLYVYSTLSGEFTMVNEFFVKEMKKLGVWNKDFVKRLQQIDGDVSKLALPAKVKDRFKTAFDVDQKTLIDVGAARQKWIDQGQSLNLYYAGDSMKALSDMYFHAWESGLKTTYYLHTRAASRIEKSNTESGSVCKIGEVCESCT